VLLLIAAALPIAITGEACAQNQLKLDEQAAIVLAAGRKAYNEKQYPVAIERFQEYLKTFGNQKDANSARYGLGLCLIEGPQKNYRLAVDTLQPLAGVGDFADRPLALYYLALGYRGLGHEALQQAVAKPQEAQQHTNTANGHFATAVAHFASAMTAVAGRTKPPAADAKELPADLEWAARCRCDQAELLLRLSKAKEALDLVTPFQADAVWKLSRYRSLGLYYLGFASFELRDYAAAARSLSQLAPFQDPTTGAHARYLLARTHHLSDDRDEAVAHYEAVIAGYDQQKAAAQKALQTPATLTGGPEEKARLEALVKSPPEYVSRASFYLGVLLYEQEKFADALTRFTAFPQQNPQSPLVPEAQLRQGFCQLELKQYAEAAKTLQPITARPELADRALLALARATVRGADPNQQQPYSQALQNAMNFLRQAIDRSGQLAAQDPQAKARRVEALLELGDTQQLAKQYKEAAATYQQILNENQAPERNEEALQRLATALHLSPQFDQADQTCQRFVQQYPKSTLLPAVLFRYAENAYVRGMASEPEKPTAQSPERQKWFAEAIKRYQPLIEKYPEFAYVSTARYRLALTHYQLSDFAAAEKALRTVPQAEQTGELTTVPYHLADCVIRSLAEDANDALAAGRLVKQIEEAVKLLEGFVAAAPTSPQAPDALLKLGYCYQRTAALMEQPPEKQKYLAAARATYEKIGQQFGNHALAPNAVFERAKVMVSQGDVGGGMNELGRFRGDPLRQSSIAPLALLRLSTLMRSQNKPGDAVTLLTECRQQHEQKLLTDTARADWAPLVQYHLGLALKESGKVPEARGLFESIVKQFPNGSLVADAAWRDGQCRKELAVARIETARKITAKPDAKPEELAAARKEIDEGFNAIRGVGQYFRDQAAVLAQKKPGSPTLLQGQLRMHYEAAWAYRLAADAEIAVTQDKLSQEALQKRIEELKKLAAANPGQQYPPPRAPEIPLKDVPLQPSEQAARDQYKALLAASADAPLVQHARLELAEMHATRGEYDPAVQLLADGLDQEPPAEMEERMRLRLGDCLLAKNDPKGAAEQFAHVADKPMSPLAPEARYRTGECFALLKDWSRAIEQWVPFRDQGPMQNLPNLSDRALLRLGHAYAHAGQWDQSRSAMDTLLGRFPQSPWRFDARYGVGWAFQNQKQYDPAIGVYTQVTRETAAEMAAKAQLQIGLCRRDQKRLPEAALALLVVPFTYDYPEWSAAALYEAARIFKDMQPPDKEQASALLKRLLKDYPESPWAKPAREQLEAAKKS
jgi:TolA-binding protein